jgi:predicted  nucleic acid-binding Zn-ribbon protein
MRDLIITPTQNQKGFNMAKTPTAEPKLSAIDKMRQRLAEAEAKEAEKAAAKTARAAERTAKKQGTLQERYAKAVAALDRAQKQLGTATQRADVAQDRIDRISVEADEYGVELIEPPLAGADATPSE